MRARWAPRRARGTATRPELRPGPGRRRLLRGIDQLLCGEWSGGIRVGMPRHGLAQFQAGLEAVAQSALLPTFGCALVGFLAGSRREGAEELRVGKECVCTVCIRWGRDS